MNRLQKFIQLAINKEYVEPRKHEIRVGEWLFEAGFNKKHIVEQPNGTKNPPDWVVYFKGEWRSIECKTQKSNTISFFNTYPNPETLYVLTNIKFNDTTVFFGYDFYDRRDKNKELINHAISCQNEIQGVISKYKSIFKNHKYNPNGLACFGRPDWKQVGGKDITNMFIPEKRTRNEYRAKIRAGNLK